MLTQKALHLLLKPGHNGENRKAQSHLNHCFNSHELQFQTGHVPPEKLLADMLKRHAASIMRDVTECPPDTLPAHIQRLDECLDLMKLVVRHGLISPPECRISGAQLCQPSTVLDFSEALAITRNQHRAPSLKGLPSSQLDRIEAKIESLAGFFSEVCHAQ